MDEKMNMGALQQEEYDPKKMKLCKVCGKPIAKNAKRCPYCGAKNKKPLFKRVSTYILLLIIVVIVAVIATSGNQYKLSDDAKNMSEKDYKAACQEVAYEDLMRNIDKYVGQKVKFTGEVFQVVYDSDSGESQYLISVTKDEYDFYTDNVYAYYTVGGNEKLIEGDIVTIYGEISGDYTYTGALGTSNTVPHMTIVYAKINK